MGLSEQLDFYRRHNRVRNRPLGACGKKLNALRYHVKEAAFRAFIENKRHLKVTKVREEIKNPSPPKTPLEFIKYLSKANGFNYGNIIGNVRTGNKTQRNFRSACIMGVLYIFGSGREVIGELSGIFEASSSFLEEYKRSYRKHEGNIKKSRFSFSITHEMLADFNRIREYVEANREKK